MSDLRVGAAGSRALDVDPGIGVGEGSTGVEGVAAGSLLPDPAAAQVGGDADLVKTLAILLTKSAREDRDFARKDERTAAEGAWQEGEAKVRDLHEKADHIRDEGWAEGLTEIGTGACDITSGLQGLDKAGDRSAEVWHGIGQGFSACGKVEGSEFKADGVEDDAKAERDGNLKDRFEQLQKSNHESVQDARDFLRKVADWYSDMKKTENESRRSAVRA